MILQNAVKIIEDPNNITYLVSFRRHDYVVHQFKDGTDIMLDGGCLGGGGGYYVRSNGLLDRPNQCQDWMLNDNDDFQKIKDRLLWGTRGKSGKEPLKWVPLKECETDHLKNILKDCRIKLNGVTEKVIESILNDRG